MELLSPREAGNSMCLYERTHTATKQSGPAWFLLQATHVCTLWNNVKLCAISNAFKMKSYTHVFQDFDNLVNTIVRSFICTPTVSWASWHSRHNRYNLKIDLFIWKLLKILLYSGAAAESSTEGRSRATRLSHLSAGRWIGVGGEARCRTDWSRFNNKA